MNRNRAGGRRGPVAVLSATFSSAEDLLHDYQPPCHPISAGRLFLAGEVPLSLGEAVRLQVGFPQLDRFITLRGTVVWRRFCSRGPALRPGVAVDIPLEEIDAVRELLIRAMASTDLDRPSPRAARRIPGARSVVPNGPRADSRSSKVAALAPARRRVSSQAPAASVRSAAAAFASAVDVDAVDVDDDQPPRLASLAAGAGVRAAEARRRLEGTVLR